MAQLISKMMLFVLISFQAIQPSQSYDKPWHNNSYTVGLIATGTFLLGFFAKSLFAQKEVSNVSSNVDKSTDNQRLNYIIKEKNDIISTLQLKLTQKSQSNTQSFLLKAKVKKLEEQNKVIKELNNQLNTAVDNQSKLVGQEGNIFHQQTKDHAKELNELESLMKKQENVVKNLKRENILLEEENKQLKSDLTMIRSTFMKLFPLDSEKTSFALLHLKLNATSKQKSSEIEALSNLGDEIIKVLALDSKYVTTIQVNDTYISFDKIKQAK